MRITEKAIAISFVAIIAFIANCGDESNDPPSNPVIMASSTSVKKAEQVNLTASATDPDGDEITYLWQATGGSFNTTSGSSVVWTAPLIIGIYTITVDAKDTHGASSYSSINIVVSRIIGSDE